MNNPDRKPIIPVMEWRQRVQQELERLTDRIAQLRQFMLTEKFQTISEWQRDLLRRQCKAMNKYADILTMRLGKTT